MTKSQRMRPLSALLAILALPAPALACPACQGAVDALVFGDGFWLNVAASIAPFVVLGTIVPPLTSWLCRGTGGGDGV